MSKGKGDPRYRLACHVAAKAARVYVFSLPDFIVKKHGAARLLRKAYRARKLLELAT